jgi:hypothetical protein
MDQLQIVISQAAAPAFILGVVASFLSVLLSHMTRILDRSRAIQDLPEGDPKKDSSRPICPSCGCVRGSFIAPFIGQLAAAL